jgi:hypothetical protein
MPTTASSEPKLRDASPEYGMICLNAPSCALEFSLNLRREARDLRTGTPRVVAERNWARWSSLRTRRASINSGLT